MRDNYCIRKASEHGDLSLVRLLVSAGADHKASSNDALFQASVNCHLEVVRYLFSCQNEDATTKYDWVRDALEVACSEGSIEIVRELLQYIREDPIARGVPLMDALVEATSNGHQGVVEELVAEGVVVDRADKSIPLNAASRQGNLELVRFLSPLSGRRSRTIALASALRSQNVEVMQYLVDHGAEVNDLLDGALQRQDQLQVEFLFRNGAHARRIPRQDVRWYMHRMRENGRTELISYLEEQGLPPCRCVDCQLGSETWTCTGVVKSAIIDNEVPCPVVTHYELRGHKTVIKMKTAVLSA